MTSSYVNNMSTIDAAKLLAALAMRIEGNAFDREARNAALAMAMAINIGAGAEVCILLTEAEKKACVGAERSFSVVK